MNTKNFNSVKRNHLISTATYLLTLLVIGFVAYGGLYLDTQGPLRPRTVQAANESNQAANAPFLFIVPSQDGTTLYVQTDTVGEIGGELFANTSLMNGGSLHVYSWTGTYSDTTQSYIFPIAGFSPEFDIHGQINLTSTNGDINTGNDFVVRASIDRSERPTIESEDGRFQLSLNNTETLPFNAHISAISHQSGAFLGTLPTDHTLIGYAYSARVSGSIVQSDKPMTLRLYYTPETLVGLDPETLTIMAWDASTETWEDRGGTLWQDEQNVSIETNDFTAYALVSKPVSIDRWRDEFAEFSKIDFSIFANLTVIRDQVENDDFVLALQSGQTNGYAASKPIVLPEGATDWGKLTFSGAGAIVVDLLDVNGNVLLANVSSGTSLASIDPTAHPSIRLKVTMTANGQTLDWWELLWEIPEMDCIPGDINCDGKVGLDDFRLFVVSYGLCEGDENFNPNADINRDGCVNIGDFTIFVNNYGQSKNP